MPQARRRAVPSIGTEASESCNLPRALTLGAAAAAAFAAFLIFKNYKFLNSIFKFAIYCCTSETNWILFAIYMICILNPYTEFHFVSLVSACRASVPRCLHHTLFFFFVVVVAIVVVVPCFVVSLCRCSLLSRLSLSLAEQLLSQCRAQPAPVIIPRSSRSTPSISEIYEIYRDIHSVKRVRVVIVNRNGFVWTVNSEKFSNFQWIWCSCLYNNPNRTEKGKEIREKEREKSRRIKNIHFWFGFSGFSGEPKLRNFPNSVSVLLCCSSVRVGGPL